MALARTTFRVYEFRRIDADDCFLILAMFCLTGTVALIHFVHPYALAQNEVSLGQIRPGADFASIMLQAKRLEEASSVLTWVTIYAVKFSYLMFFRKLLQRAKNMMVWWWIVTVVVSICGLVGIAFDWTICPNFTINFLGMLFHPFRDKC